MTPTRAQLNKFREAAESLAELGRAGFFIYLAEDTLHLLSGPSHDDKHPPRPRQDRICASVRIPLAGGGDW